MSAFCYIHIKCVIKSVRLSSGIGDLRGSADFTKPEVLVRISASRNVALKVIPGAAIALCCMLFLNA